MPQIASQIQADDPRAAVRLIDQGMMQQLLDYDRVSFQITGHWSRRCCSAPHAESPTEFELLLWFHDGFPNHVP